MNLAFAAFTQRGQTLAQRLADALGGTVTRCGKDHPLDAWTQANFACRDGLIFVGATGIAVRAVAPYLESKTTDPAVVVVDEGGTFVISLLSGHLGGANQLARQAAELLGATPVITTATDVRGLFAVDTWAKAQGCRVLEPERIKTVSGKLLAGESITLRCPWPVAGEIPQGVILTEEEDCDVDVTLFPGPTKALHVIPLLLVLGVGCRRGTSERAIAETITQMLDQLGCVPQALAKVCSIDLKAEEPGLLAFCRTWGLPLVTYSAQELEKAPGTFTPSDFVRQVTGTDNVCERSAVLGSGGGVLCQKKYTGDGVTAAVAQGSFQPEWRW